MHAELWLIGRERCENMKNKPTKTKLSMAELESQATDFWTKTPVLRHESGDWKVITIFHGMPCDTPEHKAEAYYATMAGTDDVFDRLYATHTTHIPSTPLPDSDVQGEDVYKLRNVLLRDAIKNGVSVVMTIQDGDAATLKTLQSAKSKGYRIELQSFLSHMGADAPADDYDWKSHIGALRVLPQLQDLSDSWQLNWKRLPYAFSETAMAPYLGVTQEDSITELHAKLSAMQSDASHEDEAVYDAIMYGYRPNTLSSLQRILALHINGEADKQLPVEAQELPPLCVVPSPDLRSGDFARLLRRLEGDVARVENVKTRAVAGLHHAQRDGYQKGLMALRDFLKSHVGALASQGLTLQDRKEMGFQGRRFKVQPR